MVHFFRRVQSSRAVLFVLAAVVLVHAHQVASCKKNEFRCSSLKCISKDLTCDGENDCGDFSDEINCTYLGKCNLNEFECSDRSCISSTLVCNGKFECPRGLDETNCESETTAPTTPSFEQLGILYTAEGKIKSFPVFDKSLGISLYLRFTAHKCSGNLFQMTSQNTDQFFLLSLTGDGNIEFLFKTSSGPGMVIIPPPPGDSFCNGKRHLLVVRRYLDELRYRVNRRRSVTKKIGVLREPFSRPFRVYVGMTLEGCVSGIDVVFYDTRSKTYSVGFSKGCAKPPEKTTPSPTDTTAKLIQSFTTPSLRTRNRSRNESAIHTSPTSDFSTQGHFTEDVSPNGKNKQGNTAYVTRNDRVTHSLPVTIPASPSGKIHASQGAPAQSSKVVTQSQGTRAQTPSVTQSDDGKNNQGNTVYFTRKDRVTHSLPVTIPASPSGTIYTSQGAHAQSSKVVTQSQGTRAQTPSVTQSDDVLDPYFIGEGESTVSLHTTHATSPSTSSTSDPKGLTESNYVTHSTSAVDSSTVTTARSDIKDMAPSVTMNSIFQTTTKKLPKYERCEPLRSRYCTYMGYNQTRLPTRAGYRDQLEVEKQMSRFLPFIRANCSHFLRDLICVTYLPPCSSPHSPRVQPCRELCLRSKHECASLMKAFVFDWPEYLDCEKFPSSENGKCFMAHDTGSPVMPTQATQHIKIPGCGGILTRPTGAIKTPHFPDPYPSNTLCKWAIILPTVYHVIDIILEEVSLEADVNCGYDYLLFLDGLSNQVGPRICGFLAYPRVITVKGNIASMVFRSDSALNKKGVLIKYTAHSYP